MCRAHANHSLARLRPPLVVATVAAIASQPGEGPFHHPALGQLYPTLLLRWPVDDLQLPLAVAVVVDPSVQPVVVVLAVGPDLRQPRVVGAVQLAQQRG